MDFWNIPRILKFFWERIFIPKRFENDFYWFWNYIFTPKTINKINWQKWIFKNNSTIRHKKLKFRSTEKLDFRGPAAIYIWSVWIFAAFFSVVFGWSCFRYRAPFWDFCQNYMAFWPLTSSFSVEWDLKTVEILKPKKALGNFFFSS